MLGKEELGSRDWCKVLEDVKEDLSLYFRDLLSPINGDVKEDLLLEQEF